MAEYFKNKYRIATARASWWNYRDAAAYFITICTQNRQHFFGKIENGEMILTDVGKIAHDEWLKTPEIRPDMNLELGEFVVMPNHFHAIIIIHVNKYNVGGGRDGFDPKTETETKNQFGPQSKNLASIVRGFKSSVTTQAKIMGNNDFAWQARFYDHIIRDAQSFSIISKYIVNNPANYGKNHC